MPKILIVDDDQRIRMVLRRILNEGLGWSVVEARSAPEGLQVYEKEQPDIVALDLVMPEISGDELLDTLHQKYRDALAPVVVISSDSSLQRLAPLIRQGICGYILKPFKAVDVIARLSEIFEKNKKKA